MKSPLPSKKKRKFVLSVGDEGAILIHLEGGRVLKRMFASSPAPEDTRHFDQLLASEKHTSISLLIDVMDQTYLQQTLPPVSALSVNKLIQRRIERDFSADDITGAISMGRATEGRKDWNYLFIAVSHTPPLSHWIEYVSEKPHPFNGLFLLPVEAENLIHLLYSGKNGPSLLSRFLPKKKTGVDRDAARAKWHIVVSHQKVGGFRQIVMRDGHLIFTRLAQPIGAPTPEVIAGNIEQELANTTEYLKRLAFNPAEGLDITIIVAKEIKSALNISNPNVRKVHSYTPHEVAEQLGLSKATEDGDHFGDVVFGACFGMVPRPRIRLYTPYTRKLHHLNSVRKAINTAASIVIPLVTLGILWTAYGIFTVQKDLSYAEERLSAADARLKNIEQSTANLPHDINRIADVVQLYETISAGEASPFPMISTFAQGLDENTLARAFTWESTTELPSERKRRLQTPVRASFDVEFRDNAGTLDAFIQRSERFFAKLRELFPEYDVNYSQLPGAGQDDEFFEVNFDRGQKDDSLLAQKDVTVKVTIAGPLKDKVPVKPSSKAPSALPKENIAGEKAPVAPTNNGGGA